MKKISFSKISIKNFLSVGNQPVVVDFKPGLHIITGINKDKEDRRNGVGKSTVADAIYFAVFGETLRDLKKEFIINNINKKTCEVILDVDIETPSSKEHIQIIRTLDPSKCFIFINGEDKTRDSISNTNNFIFDKFDCTSEIFQNCVIMTLNNTIPFMAKKKQEKRKFIEDIFDLSIFGSMLTEAKNELNEKKKTFDVITAKHDETQTSASASRNDIVVLLILVHTPHAYPSSTLYLSAPCPSIFYLHTTCQNFHHRVYPNACDAFYAPSVSPECRCCCFC